MTETLESLLQTLCKSVSKSTSNAEQTLYMLTDARDAKIAYDVLAACGIDAKFFADEHGSSKLYVQNASLAAGAEKLNSALASAALLKQIKNLLDQQDGLGDYTLSFTNSGLGRQLTLLLPADKLTVSRPQKSPENTPPSASSARTRDKVTAKTDEDTLLAGPKVARAAIPKSFKASATDEDPLSKRILFYLSGRAFTSSAWLVFMALIFGVVFSIIITVRGFLCPDLAVNKDTIPSYCPQHKVQQQEQ